LKIDAYIKKRKNPLTLIAVVILFHFVGLIGLYSSFSHTLFLELIPWHLLLMLAVVGGSHRPADLKFLSFVLLIYCLGMYVECTSVNYYFLFGDYTYGDIMGSKIDGVPLCIGINWFLLTYSAGIIMKKSRVRSMVIRVICGALILVALDYLIEPVAMQSHYWYWKNGTVPFENYASWFLVSAVMLAIFELFKFKKQGPVAPVFLLTQFVFFAVLHFFHR